MLRFVKLPMIAASALLLAGCRYDVLAPSGWVAVQERNLLIISTLLMLIVIIPVLFLGIYLPWKYRADRPDPSDYDPSFIHSTKLEVLIWGVPVAIIVALGAVTYVYTHRLDPYRPLDIAGTPLKVEAVSLDWKWLFIYPEEGVAAVNELALPAGRPVEISLTSSTVMNTLSIPALSGMVYSMAGMETKLHLVADHAGTFAGRSAHYSGPGFSQMTFDTLAMEEGDFDAWVQKARNGDTALTRAAYMELEKPSIAAPVQHFGNVAEGLFDRIVGLCVEDGKVCMSQMMMQDMHGGGGKEGIPNAAAYEYDNPRRIDGHGNLMPPLPGSQSDHDLLSQYPWNDPDQLCGLPAEQEKV
ncbi:ubiquinol oxidase subunit II [Pseudooceanicola algae]|uniref:Ubiquinol oxidase subunit 2 n=1 Tax=Pseudooceanicola algae TaxID=1537215 RepID=A0A418SHS3_9RHOB|nr:ubiquinol oxidase subunit II [Pseudooceanicola algae]QPM90238.1 hypothetical protein PSAL_014730 [Pseudooceanicola algae]